MNQPIKITITQEDIDRAVQMIVNDPSILASDSCPVGLAISRKLNIKVRVIEDGVFFPPNDHNFHWHLKYTLDDRIKRWIRNFDKCKRVNPTSFYLKGIPLERWGQKVILV